MQSIAPPDDTVYGVSLTALLARVHSMAHRYYRRHGRWEPYEEYLSAGHLALAECLQRYDPAQGPPGGFTSYCLFQVEMQMRTVRRKAAGKENMPVHIKGQYMEPKYTIEHVDHEILYALRMTPATQETTTYLQEVLAYLATRGKPAVMLLASVEQDSYDTLADTWQCSHANIAKHIKQCRTRLRAWCAA